MRRLLIAVILVSSLFALAKDPETTEQLKARAAAAEENKQPKLYLELAQRQLTDADQAYNTSADQAKAILDEAIQSAQKAAETSVKTGKDLKKVEIGLREIGKKLDNLSRSWALDDRPPIKDGMQKVDEARTTLLNRMFQK